MNNEEVLREKFCENNDYPIWYYKELEALEVDEVIWNLLKESFVVEIDGIKYELTFGKNKDSEIGHCSKRNDIKKPKSTLCSFDLIQKGFKEGSWFRVSKKDTTEEFKSHFDENKEEQEKINKKEMYQDLLSRAVENNDGINDDTKIHFLEEIKNYSLEELESLFDKAFPLTDITDSE